MNLTDLLVGAPYEGSGAVYVFHGSLDGIGSQYSQRITPKDLPDTFSIKGFGMSFSRPYDFDSNHYNGK